MGSTDEVGDADRRAALDHSPPGFPASAAGPCPYAGPRSVKLTSYSKGVKWG